MQIEPWTVKSPLKIAKAPDPALKKSDATLMRIVDAAAYVFRHHGYAGSKLGDIAKVAKIKTGSLYYYFDSREALVEEVLLLGTRRIIDAMDAAIRNCPPDATWRMKIQAAAEAHLTKALEFDDYTAATLRIFAQVPAPIRSRHRVYQEAHGRVWRSLLESAAHAGEIRNDIDLTVARLLFIGSMNWSIEWYKSDRGNLKQICDQLVETFFNGIAKNQPTSRGVK